MRYLLDLLGLLPLILAAPNPTPAPQSPATQSPGFPLSAAYELPPKPVSAASAASAATAFAAIPTSSVDECVPLLPSPSLQENCIKPVLLSPTPSAYGVQCLNDTLPPTTHPLNITACVDPIRTICSYPWQYSSQWLWASAPGCTVGSFLPSSIGNDNYTVEWPNDQSSCEELIYLSMLNECETTDRLWNVAAVNLEVLPDNSLGGYGMGKQVDGGYGSYLVSERQLRNLSDAQGCVENVATTTYGGKGKGKESIPVVTDCAAVGKAADDLELVTTADET